MALTQNYESDFHLMFPTSTFKLTVFAPNGDETVFHELTPEQMETLWRMYEGLALRGWDVRWECDGSL